MTLLAVENVTKRFGGLLANDSISFAVPEQSVFAVIGPNGAGKTTLFNAISGFLPPTAGRIVFAGDDITGHPQRVIVKVVHFAATTESRRFFPHHEAHHAVEPRHELIQGPFRQPEIRGRLFLKVVFDGRAGEGIGERAPQRFLRGAFGIGGAHAHGPRDQRDDELSIRALRSSPAAFELARRR